MSRTQKPKTLRPAGRRAIAKQQEVLAEAMAVADDRIDHWKHSLQIDDAESLEYFAHGMEGVMDLIQNVANEAGYLAEMIDPEIGDKV